MSTYHEDLCDRCNASGELYYFDGSEHLGVETQWDGLALCDACVSLATQEAEQAAQQRRDENIAAAEEAVEAVTQPEGQVATVEQGVGEHESVNVLMARGASGLIVQLSWLPITETCVLTCRVDDTQFAVTVDPAAARDAFDHPMIYLTRAQTDELFPRRGL